jgi:hypothetical protein
VRRATHRSRSTGDLFGTYQHGLRRFTVFKRARVLPAGAFTGTLPAPEYAPEPLRRWHASMGLRPTRVPAGGVPPDAAGVGSGSCRTGNGGNSRH